MPSLVEWHGSPMTLAEAERAVTVAGHLLALAHRHRTSTREARLAKMQGRFWLALSVDIDYRELCAVAKSPHERALSELVYGALLMSCKVRPAMDHLDAGLDIARHLLDTRDYFTLVKRHGLLRELSLTASRQAPQSLQGLLAEASVVRRLRAMAGPRKVRFDSSDTLG